MLQTIYHGKTIYAKLIVVWVLLLGLSNCSSQVIEQQNTYEKTHGISRIIEGPLNDEVAQHILNLDDNYKELILTSPGGYPSRATMIANKIINKKYKISIYKLCASACAEYLLPAANATNPDAKVIFIDSPIIGFHWNAMLTEYIMKQSITDNIDHCSFNDSSVLKNLQTQGGLNSKHWKETLERLGENYSEYRLNSEGCPEIKIKFENEYWLPTSIQLRDLYWLDFEGEVCADNLSKCSKTIDQIWPKGKRIVVGDEVYTSKGQSK